MDEGTAVRKHSRDARAVRGGQQKATQAALESLRTAPRNCPSVQETQCGQTADMGSRGSGPSETPASRLPPTLQSAPPLTVSTVHHRLTFDRTARTTTQSDIYMTLVHNSTMRVTLQLSFGIRFRLHYPRSASLCSASDRRVNPRRHAACSPLAATSTALLVRLDAGGQIAD